jgi:hypothetical protein
MNKYQNHTLRAMYELGDYISRLGGAARPFNIAESEIQLYIACTIIELNDGTFNPGEYLDQAFVEAATPIIEKVNLYLSSISLSATELMLFVMDFYKYADDKLNSIEKTPRWQAFGAYLRKRITQHLL